MRMVPATALSPVSKACNGTWLKAIVHEMMPGAAQIRGGYLYGSEKPGLGIDLNEEIAARFPLIDDARVSDWTTVRGVDGSVVKP